MSLTSFLVSMKRQGAAPKIVNEYISAAEAFLTWCVQQPRFAANPLANIVRTRDIKKTYERRALTVEEARRLLSVAGPRRLVYLTAIRTGLRRSELKELCWGDLHIEPFELRPYIALRAETTKARRGDIIPLRKDLARELREARLEEADPSTKVFKTMPKMATFKLDPAKADIEHIDSTGDLPLNYVPPFMRVSTL